MRWATPLFAVLCISISGSALAETSLSWLEKLRYLRFGNERGLVIKDAQLDLTDLKADEYWFVRGNILFYPGEFINPEQFQSIQNWERLIQEKQPILVEMNNQISQKANNPSPVHFGTFALKVKALPKQKLSLLLNNIYHPMTVYLANTRQVSELSRIGQLSQDPSQNSQIYSFLYPTNSFESTEDFTLVMHVASPVNSDFRSPNFSSFFIGPERYLDREFKILLALNGVIIGCFLIASIFYAFIFSFRPRDRSSLYLSLYAFLSFVMAAAAITDFPIATHAIMSIITCSNMLGSICLLLFIAEKIKPHMKASAGHYLSLVIMGQGLVILMASTLSLWPILSTLYFLMFGQAIALIFTTIYLGFRHQINGLGYFIVGGILDCAFQFPIMIHGANEPDTMDICLANLSMTIAIALVNAKDFAITYKSSEQLRQELQKLLKEVQDKEQARTLFFQNTSHELRTPLNGIIGFMQLITQNRYGQIPEAVEGQLQKCIRLAISLKNQVNAILDLAKAKKGNLALCNSAISLVELMREAEDLAGGLLLKRPDFQFHSSGQWDSKQGDFIGDREKISAIIRNLLGNAFKFSDPIRSNTIDLKMVREGQHLIITVSDTGIGIPPEHQDKVFEEFQQVAGDARRAYEGTGLGLAMVRDFVKLMGGYIRLESEHGKGSRFTIDIPEQTAIHVQKPTEINLMNADKKVIPMARPVPGKPLSKAQSRGRLLVVDDNEMNCEVLKDVLEQDGFAVRTVLDGREALRIMRQEHPDLLLLDMMMPYFSGEDVIKAMQSDNILQDIPIILITARASEDDRIFGLSLGADDYLAKPIHHEELLFRVKNILERLEVKKKLVEAEEGQKLAQMGRLMQEYSHELKNVFQGETLRLAEIPASCERILRRIPLSSQEWQEASRLISMDKHVPAEKSSLGDLVFDHPSQSMSLVLKSLRANIACIDMNAESRLKLWRQVLELSPEIQQECEQTTYIIQNFTVMQHQTLYASELVKNILDFARRDEAPNEASTVAVLDRVVRLVKPRLQSLGIKIQIPSEDHTVSISQSNLMQVLLNLISNACDSLETIERDNRWIRISIATQNNLMTLSCANEGIPFTPEMAENMLQNTVKPQDQKNYGLGLGISLRLIQRARGRLEVNCEARTPEINIILTTKPSQSLRYSA